MENNGLFGRAGKMLFALKISFRAEKFSALTCKAD
ncbi:MAG: hypothetical protein AVDCRST_MAG74-3650 [uncultured Pyrinomonadaceae bacterium]|uniref:Uncharacterized protein n=1 Tax=uncultured Pyrinomonadaceae bacterium TaxID=2283094 RepID=A0A6J4PZU8_9BACT|nr:MAG: hypothetical protein AVDCRST_MAG74-3650 [uncultured Pyrinomonadaceae bacterium]